MGTRNLTMIIDKRGDLKVAQYGQWDGYPEGWGVEILNFARDKEKMAKLEKELDNIKFFNRCDDIERWLQGYSERERMEYDKALCQSSKTQRTDADMYWFKNLISRDLCGEILESIISIDKRRLPKEHNEYLYLKDSSDFGKSEGIFGCEWAYCINFKENLLQCYTNLNDFLTEYDLNCLPTNEDFCKELRKLAGFEEGGEE